MAIIAFREATVYIHKSIILNSVLPIQIIRKCTSFGGILTAGQYALKNQFVLKTYVHLKKKHVYGMSLIRVMWVSLNIKGNPAKKTLFPPVLFYDLPVLPVHFCRC